MFRRPYHQAYNQFFDRGDNSTDSVSDIRNYIDNDFSFGSDANDNGNLTAIFRSDETQDSEADEDIERSHTDDDAEEGCSVAHSSDEECSFEFSQDESFVYTLTIKDALALRRVELIDSYPQFKLQINALAYKAGIYEPRDSATYNPAFNRFFNQSHFAIDMLPLEIVKFVNALEAYEAEQNLLETPSKRA